MPYQFRIGSAIYRKAVAQTPPSRGPVFIGRSGDDISSLSEIIHYCFDFRRIFFALVYPAEDYCMGPDTEFRKIAVTYPYFPQKFPGGLYKEILAEQIAPVTELEKGKAVCLKIPTCVLYTGRIDKCAGVDTQDICGFLELLCDYYAITRMKVQSDLAQSISTRPLHKKDASKG